MQASSVKVAWKVMLVMGIYGAVLGLLQVFLTKTMVTPQFTAFTGQSWPDFLANNPKPAELFIMTRRVLGVAMFVIGFLAVLIAWKSYSKAEKWSWYTLLVAGIIAWGSLLTYLITIGYLMSRNMALAIFGIVLFVIAIMLPAKAILRKQPVKKTRNSERPSPQQEQQWWRLKRTWVIIIISLGAVVFGIIQPFVWTWVYKQYPPISTVALSTLLTIVLAFLALGVGAFGTGVYLILKGKVEEIARTEAEERSSEVQKRVTYQLVLQFVTIAINLAYQNWREGEGLKEEKKRNPGKEYMQDMAIDCLRDALRFAESTLPVTEHKDFWENPENRKRLVMLKNNLAYYMAHKGRKEDVESARKYAREVEQEARSQSVPNYHLLDTVAWVLKQFALSEKDKQKSKSIVTELEQRPDIKEDDKEKLLRKYKNNPGVP